MSRRNIRFIQNFVLLVLCVSMWGMHQVTEKSKETKLLSVSRKIAVSQSLKDCLKANASPELRDATQGISAPTGRDSSVTSFLVHFKSAIGRLSPSAYKDAYATLDKCGLGISDY